MHISIIEDERILATKIGKKLKQNGYSISLFGGYKEFMLHGDTESQLYIVDISLQDGSGFDIVNHLRKEQHSHVPIIIISGFGDSNNIIYGLDIGADDYLTKPFIPDELLARVKAVLRRPDVTVDVNTIIQYRDLVYDVQSKILRLHDEIIPLSRTEGRIVEYFLLHRGKVVTRAKLIADVWGTTESMDVTDNTINVTLSKIRKKLPGNFKLRTVYNQGYMLS